MQHVDTLIHAQWIIPVEPDDTVLEHHSLAIRDGDIVAMLPSYQAREQFSAEHTVELPQHALIPGLVNCHTHASMSLLRGYADDLPLMDWLQNHIWPAEARWVGERFVHQGTQLAVAESLRGGVTCFNDMYFFPDQAALAAEAAGMRAVVGLIVIDFPTVWAGDADEYLEKAIQVHDRFRDNPLISTAFAPHAPYTVSDQPLQRIVTLAEELDLPIHMHVHETAHEVDEGRRNHGHHPLTRLQRLGLLSPRLLAVHMTQLDDADIGQCAETGLNVVHCPESNLKLASGFCPLARLVAAGVNVALGSDGAASNNDLDMLGEMRTAALLAKAVAGDAAAIPAHTALRMATLNGARALGLDQRIGSLRPGKAADLAAIDLGSVETQPVYHPISHIVYAASRNQVSDVWVAGRHLLRQRKLTTLDESQLRADARAWAEKIQHTRESS